MRIIVLFFYLLLASATFAQRPSAATAEQWDTILNKAKQQNKLVLIDFSTSWCGPCKAMDQNVFTDKTVSSTLEQYYTFIKVDAEKDELGRVLAARYMVRGFPTFLVIDPALNVLSKESGYKPADQFNSWLIKSAKQKGPDVAGFSQTKYLDFPDFYLSSFGEKEVRGVKPDSNTVADYLNKQKDLTSEISWAVMNAFEMPHKYFNYFKTNYQVYKKKYGTSIEAKMAYGLFPELDKAIKTKSTEGFVAVLNQIPKYFDDAGLQQSTYLINIPLDSAFLMMKTNFVDTAKSFTPELKLQNSSNLLMNKSLPKAAAVKAISWLVNYPDIENSGDLYILMSLASAYQILGDQDKSQAFFKKGEEAAKGKEEAKGFVEYYKKKLNL